jgi:hypothetical protein
MDRKSVSNTVLFTESPALPQAPLTPLPLRSRGPVPDNNRLAVLAADIRAAHQEVTRGAQGVAERALAAGRMLIETKDSLPHGAWEPWLAQHVGMSARTARRYMQLAHAGLKSATVADLGIRAASERVARLTALARQFGISAECADRCLRLAAIPGPTFEAAIARIEASGSELTAEAIFAFAEGRARGAP